MARKIAHPILLPLGGDPDQRLSIGDGAVPEQSDATGKVAIFVVSR